MDPTRARYVVTKRTPGPDRLAPVLAAIPGAVVLRIAEPEHAVVSMTPAEARGLADEHPELLVELDARHDLR